MDQRTYHGFCVPDARVTCHYHEAEHRSRALASDRRGSASESSGSPPSTLHPSLCTTGSQCSVHWHHCTNPSLTALQCSPSTSPWRYQLALDADALHPHQRARPLPNHEDELPHPPVTTQSSSSASAAHIQHRPSNCRYGALNPAIRPLVFLENHQYINLHTHPFAPSTLCVRTLSPCSDSGGQWQLWPGSHPH